MAKEGKTTPGTKMTNVDIDMLDTDNYAVWSIKIKSFLIIKDLWTAVSNESDPKPGADEKALAQLSLHFKDHHIPLLSKAKTAAEAWQKLKAIYQAKAQPGSSYSSESSTASTRSPMSLWSST